MKMPPVIPVPASKNCPCVSDTQGHCVFPFIGINLHYSAAIFSIVSARIACLSSVSHSEKETVSNA